jgi:glycosyltransferase involved in cell wall biosynthesis
MSNIFRVQVGIPTLGGSEWVAGAIYTSNLYRAIGLLPSDARLSGVLLERAYRRSTSSLSGIGSARRYHFSHISSARETTARRLAKRAVSLVRHPKATSLEEVVRKVGVNLLFPLSHTIHGLDCAQAHWIPDFQHCRYPEYFPGRSGIERREEIQRQLAEARFIVLSSTSSLDDALQYHPEHAAKYRVLNFVTLPEDSWFSRDPASVSHFYSGHREFLIFPAQLWAHKGHDTLLQAVALLRKRVSRDILVLCPGHRSDFRRPQYFAG